MATEDWIQESLARLESLEEERKKHEDALETATDPATLRMHTQAIDRLEVKIRALYAELEAVANESQTGEGEEAGAEEAAGEEEGGDPTHVFRPDDLARAAAPVAAAAPEPVAATPAPVASRPTPAPAPMASPFGGPPQPSVSPFGEAPVAAPFGSPALESQPFSSSSTPSFDSGDLDSESSGGGGGAKIAIIVVLLAALGGGAYFFLNSKKEETPPPTAAPTEIKVIKSGEVPPDTQGPRTAKGGDITSTQGSQIKESDRPRQTGGGGGGSSSSSSSSSEKPKKKDSGVKIEQTDDPLAGIR